MTNMYLEKIYIVLKIWKYSLKYLIWSCFIWNWFDNDSLGSIKLIYDTHKVVLELQIAHKDWSFNSFATILLQKWNFVQTTLMWKNIDSRQSRFRNIQLEGAYSERVVLESVLSKLNPIFRWNTLCFRESYIT